MLSESRVIASQESDYVGKGRHMSCAPSSFVYYLEDEMCQMQDAIYQYNEEEEDEEEDEGYYGEEDEEYYGEYYGEYNEEEDEVCNEESYDNKKAHEEFNEEFNEEAESKEGISVSL
ncbi:hypothetical protein CPLU01_07408, partial [Colletotrichum plurivorum]